MVPGRGGRDKTENEEKTAVKRTPLALVGAGLLALGIGACGDSGVDVGSNTSAPELATPPEDNAILRGDVGDFVWCDTNDNGAQDDGPSSGVNGSGPHTHE